MNGKKTAAEIQSETKDHLRAKAQTTSEQFNETRRQFIQDWTVDVLHALSQHTTTVLDYWIRTTKQKTHSCPNQQASNPT